MLQLGRGGDKYSLKFRVTGAGAKDISTSSGSSLTSLRNKSCVDSPKVPSGAIGHAVEIKLFGARLQKGGCSVISKERIIAHTERVSLRIIKNAGAGDRRFILVAGYRQWVYKQRCEGFTTCQAGEKSKRIFPNVAKFREKFSAVRVR